MRCCLALVVCIGWQVGLAQPKASGQAQIDSLRQVIDKAQSDTTRVRAWVQLSAAYRTVLSDVSASAEAARQGVALARRIGFLRGLYEAQSAWVSALSQGDNLQQALEVNSQLLYLKQRKSDTSGLQSILNNQASLHFYLGAADSAMLYFRRAVDLILVWGDSADAVYPLSNIATLLKNQGKLSEALHLYQLGYRVGLEKADSSRMAYCLNNIADINFQNGDLQGALRTYLQSIALIEHSSRFKSNLGSAYYHIALVYSQLRQLDPALNYLRKAYALSASIQLWALAGVSSSRLSNHFLDLGRIDSARKYIELARGLFTQLENTQVQSLILAADAQFQYRTGNYSQARFLGQQALDLSREQVGSLENQKGILQNLYLADSAAGDFRAALHHYREYIQIRDSLESASQARQLGRLETQAAADLQLAQQQAEQAAERLRSRWTLGTVLGMLLLLAALALILFRSRRRTLQANTALQALNQAIGRQRDEIETQHRQIEDSIRYASRIQQAILPTPEQLATALPPHFILYKPRDIVSGDFYWFATLGDQVFLAAVDCTGHGVPGAFMSVVGHTMLNQVVSDTGITRPEAILKALDRRIGQLLHQQLGSSLAESSLDGMDLALVVLHPPTAAGIRTLEYAGAGRPLWVWNGQQLAEFRSGRHPCGGTQQHEKSYPSHRLDLPAGSRVYLGSDGLTDQFGGELGRKLGSRRLLEWLEQTAHLPIAQQGQTLEQLLAEWQGNRRQLDDLLLIGLQIE